MDEPQVSSISRRDLLKLGGAAIAAGSGSAPGSEAGDGPDPKRGGTFRLRIHVAPRPLRSPADGGLFPPCRRCPSPIAGS